MSAQRKTLIELVENLPPDLEQEVNDFVLFVLERRKAFPVHPVSQFHDLIEMAEKHDFSSGRDDISSRSSELAREAIAKQFSQQSRHEADEQTDSH